MDDDDKTKESFFLNNAGVRYYKSGDLVSENESGLFRFWGRLDRQVKINGYRIEIQEVEEIINSFTGVISCHVIKKIFFSNRVYLLENEKNNKKGSTKEILVAYIVAKKIICKNKIKKFLEKNLPLFMIPERFIQIDEMPMTVNGKIDEVCLPEITNISQNTNSVYVKPANKIEKEVAAIWEEVLGIEPIGKNDKFIELGGDSLAFIEVITRIEMQLNMYITYSDFYLSKDLSDLCTKLTICDEKTSKILNTKKNNYFKLSFSQQGQYFLWKLYPLNAYYMFQGNLHLFANISLMEICEILNIIIKTNDILRTNFIPKSGTVVQFVREFKEQKFYYEDLSQLSNKEIRTYIINYGKNKAKNSFNLEKDNLFQWDIFKVEEGEFSILLTMHEIIMDAWSTYKLIQDFINIYNLSDNEKKNYGKSYQYSDFSEWENIVCSEEKLAKEKLYWKRILEGELPILDLNIGINRPDILSYKSQNINKIIESSEYECITKFIKNNNLTLFTFLMCIYSLSLYTYSNPNEIIIGCPNASRNSLEKENMYGCFLNMLPIRIKIDENTSFDKFFIIVNEIIQDAMDNANYPFLRIVEDKKIMRSNNISPIFQVMFDMVNFPIVDFTKNSDIIMSFEEIDLEFRKYDLNLYAYEQENKIYLRLSYQSEIFNKKNIEKFMETYMDILHISTSNTCIKIFDLQKKLNKLSCNSEIDKIEKGIKKEECDKAIFNLLNNKNISDDQIIYKDSDDEITYKDLRARIFSTVNKLYDYGISKNNIVIIYADKDINTIINILALLVIEAVYVPFDILKPYKSNVI